MSKIWQALEMARCAEINVDNITKMIPMLKSHPMIEIVKMQIQEVINLLDDDSDTTAQPQPEVKPHPCGHM